MVRVLRLFLFPTALAMFSSVGLVPAACGQSRIDCDAITSRILKQTVHYCVLLPAGYDADGSKQPAPRYPVLYFLHGLGENEQTLFNTGGWNLIEDLRQQHKIGDLLIVAPEGEAQLLHQLRRRPRALQRFLSARIHAIDRALIPRPAGAGGKGHHRSFHGRVWGAAFGICTSRVIFIGERAECRPDDRFAPGTGPAMRSGSPLGRVLGAVFGDPIDVAHWRENNPFVLAKEHPAELRQARDLL